MFIALAAFWLTLPLKAIAAFLAFLSILATFPLLFELYRKLLNGKRTLNLTIFTNIFALLAGYSIWYVLVAFRPQWKTELSKVVFWSIFLSILFTYRWIAKSRFLKWMENRITVLFLNPIDDKIKRIRHYILLRIHKKSLEKSDYSKEEKEQALINYKNRLEKLSSMTEE